MKHALKIALIGYGKMGQAIEEIALQKGHADSNAAIFIY
jgi:pyrroline-5-carboxylate reductase